MITNKGSEIIAKYMLGQAPEYAAYIAVGVGSKPLAGSQNDTSLPTKKSMDFEAFRVPVSSRGIVNDTITLDLSHWSVSSNIVTITTTTHHGVNVGDSIVVTFSLAGNSAKNSTFASPFVATDVTSNTITYSQTISASAWVPATGDIATVSYVRDRIIFKAQLPPDQKYRMTEIALFPAASNQLALGYDSKLLLGFLTTEGWSRYDGVDNAIDIFAEKITDAFGVIESASIGKAKFINSDNAGFTTPRKGRQESPRLYNRCLMVKGDLTAFSSDAMAVDSSSNYVSTSSISFDLSKNSPLDYIKLALSVLSETETPTASPNKVRVRIEFLNFLSGGAVAKAVYTKVINQTELDASRYQVISAQLQDFVVDPSFTWSKVSSTRVYVQTLDVSDAYDGSYVILDGMRIDNENTSNPLYGMVAYSVLRNSIDDGLPIDKIENSQGYIEYRLGVSIF